MPLAPETLARPRDLGIEVAGPDDPIYKQGAAVIIRPGSAITRTPEHQQALDEATMQVYREAIETMKAYCRTSEEHDQ